MELLHQIAPIDAPNFDPCVAESIARETAAPIEVAARVYREELDALVSKARITQFLHVIASRRALEASAALSPPRRRSAVS